MNVAVGPCPFCNRERPMAIWGAVHSSYRMLGCLECLAKHATADLKERRCPEMLRWERAQVGVRVRERRARGLTGRPYTPGVFLR